MILLSIFRTIGQVPENYRIMNLKMPSLPLLLLSVLSLLTGCRADEPTESEESLQFRFSCEVLSTDEEAPRAALYTTINESKVKIAEISVCDLLEKEDWEQYRIPKEALGAAGGWWAGAGDYFYAVPDSNRVVIYRASVDEAEEAGSIAYRVVAGYEEGQYNIEIPLGREELAGVYVWGGLEESYVLFLGLRGEKLEGQFFQLAGRLPPSNQLIQYLPALEPIRLDSLELDLETLRFTSTIGTGYFQREDDILTAVFEEIDLPDVEPITLDKLD